MDGSMRTGFPVNMSFSAKASKNRWMSHSFMVLSAISSKLPLEENLDCVTLWPGVTEPFLGSAGSVGPT